LNTPTASFQRPPRATTPIHPVQGNPGNQPGFVPQVDGGSVNPQDFPPEPDPVGWGPQMASPVRSGNGALGTAGVATPATPDRDGRGFASSGGSTGGDGKKYVDYRVEPAPAWGGDAPERNYKEYHRNLQLWLVEAEARLPHNLIGKRIIDSIPLGSKLSAMLAHLTVDEITSDQGHRTILNIIEEAHEYLRDHRLETAFDEAIFRGRRERGQPLTTFLANKKAAFAELRKQGLDLLGTQAGRHLLGHLIIKQGSFSQDQRQRLKVVTNGSIDYKEVEKAIQKVFGDKLDDVSMADGMGPQRRWRSATYWGEDDDYPPDEWDENDEMATCAAGDYLNDYEETIFDDLVCLGETDEMQLVFHQELPVVMDESEALEAVGHQFEEIFFETRDRLKGKGKGKKGKGRGHSHVKTFGSTGKPSFGGGRGGGYLEHRRMLQASRNGRGFDRPWQQRQGSRMSLGDLKSRSRCHNCKQIGHWSKECPLRSKQSAPPTGSSKGTMMSQSSSVGFSVSRRKRSLDSFSPRAFRALSPSNMCRSPSCHSVLCHLFFYLLRSQLERHW
jgi:hypothetical protein